MIVRLTKFGRTTSFNSTELESIFNIDKDLFRNSTQFNKYYGVTPQEKENILKYKYNLSHTIEVEYVY